MARKKHEADEARAEGVRNVADAKKWVAQHRVTEIECVVPDQAGVARGKIMPASKFLADPTMALPSSIFLQTISGEYPDLDEAGPRHDPSDGDIELVPDFTTLTRVPWAQDPTAQIILDAQTRDGRPLDIAPRQVLKRMVDLYAREGLTPVVAPELEFYLVKKNVDPDYPLEPPIGRSGRPEAGRRSYSISAVNEFDPLFEKIYDYADAQELEVDTLIHEEGAAQMEINLRHGDPVWLADQVFLLKRTIREAALEHDIYATFMAKPIAAEPGSAMHIHQSIISAETGENIFSDDAGKPTAEFFAFIAGQQRYMPAVMAIIAPYVNSWRRLSRGSTAPVNVEWGYDNRTTGLRVPPSRPDARRVENRLPSSDANPYLAIAASLACGWLGLQDGKTPREPINGIAVSRDEAVPHSLLEAVALMEHSEEIREIFGENFVATYAAIKRAEYETFMRVISPWEREYLLLGV
jgi:glutamine synthetase